MGHEDQLHHVFFLFLLDDLRQAYALVGHAACHVAQNAGLVMDHKAHIEFGMPVFGRHNGSRQNFIAGKARIVRPVLSGYGQKVA